MRQHMKENLFWSQDKPQLVPFLLRQPCLRNADVNTGRQIFMSYNHSSMGFLMSLNVGWVCWYQTGPELRLQLMKSLFDVFDTEGEPTISVSVQTTAKGLTAENQKKPVCTIQSSTGLSSTIMGLIKCSRGLELTCFRSYCVVHVTNKPTTAIVFTL